MSYAYVEFLEVFETYFWLDRLCLIGSFLVGLLGVGKFLELLLYHLVFYLLEEELWLAQLVASLQQVGASELCPFEVWHIDHLAELLRREWQEWLKGDGEVGNQLE